MAFGNPSYRIGTWRDYVKEIPWPVGPDFLLEPSTTALLVIDMTRLQCEKDAPVGVANMLNALGGPVAGYYFETMRRVVPAIRTLLDFFHESRLEVVFLTCGPYLSSERELPFFMRRINSGFLDVAQRKEVTGRYQFEVIPQLVPREGDLILHKITASAFVGTSLDLMLRNLGIDTLVLTGAATQACVEATARSGADLGYRIVLAEDGCLTQSPLFHDMTMMNCIHLNWGKVLDSAQIVEELRQQESNRRAGIAESAPGAPSAVPGV